MRKFAKKRATKRKASRQPGLDHLVKDIVDDVGIPLAEQIRNLEKQLKRLKGEDEDEMGNIGLEVEEDLEDEYDEPRDFHVETEAIVHKIHSITLEGEELKELMEDYDGDIEAWFADRGWEYEEDEEWDDGVTVINAYEV